nr:uncharacterized protein LOC104091156 [Nicotiana tomentosiformis]
MCQSSSESVSHLFFHCRVAKELWNMFCSLFGIQWVMPQHVGEAYASWSLWRVEKTIKKIWVMIPAVIFWCLWNERNRRSFDEDDHSDKNLDTDEILKEDNRRGFSIAPFVRIEA